MFNRASFAERFKIIKTTHQLTGGEIRLLLNIKSSSNITAFEKGQQIPSLDLFTNMCELFAVSCDWLLGYTDTPYNQAFLLKIEQKVISSQITVNGSRVSLFNPLSFPEEYYYDHLRSQYYPPEVRANIVFLMHIEAAFITYSYIHNSFGSSVDSSNIYYQALADNKFFSKKQGQHKQYRDMLLNLLNKKIPAQFLLKTQKAKE